MAAYRSKFTEEENNDNFHDLSDDPEMMNIRQQQDYHRQQMVQSSNRSVQMIIESQTTAIETADELRKQREQLERTSKNLDKINSDLNESDRNITSLKGIWGTMSNWFKKPLKKTEEDSSKTHRSSEDDDRRLQEEARNIQQNLKKLDNIDVDSGAHSGASGASQYRTAEDDIVDKNLDTMLAGLTMLKSQGLSLRNELDDHNELIVDISKKSETADVRIEDQNKRMNKILR